MTKTIKVLLGLIFGILICSVIGIYIYVSSQLDTDELRLIVLEKIEKNFPNSKSSIKEISLDFGQSIELRSKEIEIYTNDDDALVKIEDVTLKVPLFSIILGGGNIEVDINSPQFFFHENEKGSNWEKALKDNTASELFKFKDTKELIIPAFLANSTLAFRLHNSEITHKDIQERVKVTNISKFIIKNLGINSNAAYELKSNFTYPFDNGEVLSFDSFIVGSINFPEYLKNDKLPLKASYKFDEIKISGKGDIAPMINGSLDGTVSSTGDIFLNHSLRMDKSSLKHQITLNSEEVSIHDIGTIIFLSDLNLLMSYVKIPIKINEGKLIVNGNISANKEGYYPKLKVIIKDFKGDLPGSSYEADGELDASVGKATIKGHANLYDGSITVDSQLNFAANENLSFDKKIKSLKTNFTLADMKLSTISLNKIFMREHLINDKSAHSWPVFFILPNSEVNGKVVNSKLNNKSLSMTLNIKTNKNRSKMNDFKIQLDRGLLSATGEAYLYEDGINSNWKLKATKFPSEVFKIFFNEDSTFLDGELDAQVDGPFSVKNGKNIYDLKFDFESKKGELTGINLNGAFDNIKKQISNIPILSNEIKWKKKEVSNKYDSFKASGVMKDEKVELKKIEYIGDSKELILNAKGNIFLNDKESRLTGTAIDKLGLQDYMKREFAIKSIPFALKGNGRDLKFDDEYSRKKILSHFKGKEGKAKINKVIDKNVDKYLKGDSGKKIKELIKGFLK